MEELGTHSVFLRKLWSWSLSSHGAVRPVSIPLATGCRHSTNAITWLLNQRQMPNRRVRPGPLSPWIRSLPLAVLMLLSVVENHQILEFIHSFVATGCKHSTNLITCFLHQREMSDRECRPSQ